MTIAQSLAGEFDHEMGNTRRVLERVPGAHVAWRPHAKSFSLGDLALHIANVPTWMGITLNMPEFDMDPDNNPEAPDRAWESTESLLATFDANVAAARHILTGTTDGQMMEPWTFKKRGKLVLTMPKVAVVRAFVFSHIVHHRGQLTVYLRLKDVPLPGIYGPTADEPD